MHLDMTPGQLGPLRPTAALAAHRTPVEGLFVSGAGTRRALSGRSRRDTV